MQTDFKNLPELREEYSDRRIVFRGGCFDLLHIGHLEALQFAKQQGDLLLIGIVSDERIKHRKGFHRPIVSELSRLAVVDAIRFVDITFIMPMPTDGPTSSNLQVVKALRPDVLVDNGESVASWPRGELERMEALGTQVIIDPHRDHRLSTTALIDKIIQTRGM
jgi:D-beta-D-heptose 7-phosphate kinase/D-beta-D-heptose 1-phosphate adenosyltransferase